MNGSPYDDERISAYLDGELSSEEREAFEGLLSEREDYRQAVEELRETSNVVRSLPQEKLPDDFARRVLRRAEQEMLVGGSSNAKHPSVRPPQDTTSWTRRMFWPLAAIAASLLLLVFGPDLSPTNTNVAVRSKTNTATSEAEAIREEGLDEKVESNLNDLAIVEYTVPNVEAQENPDTATTPSNSRGASSFGLRQPEATPEQIGVRTQPQSPEPVSRAIESPSASKAGPPESDVNMMMDVAVPAETPLTAASVAADTVEEKVPLIESQLARLGMSYASNEDYDAITNVRTDINDFYETLAKNQIQFDQRLLTENLVRQETQSGSNYFAKKKPDPATAELVLVEARPEKLQKVVTALSKDSRLASIVSNPNSLAKEQIQNNFANVVDATPELVEKQALMMRNVQPRRLGRDRSAVPQPYANQDATKPEQLQLLGCRAICLGKVTQQADDGRGRTQQPSDWAVEQSRDQPKDENLDPKLKPSALPATNSSDRMTRSLSAIPARAKDSELRRLAESATTSPVKSEGDPSEQKERVRMLFLIQEPEVKNVQVPNEEK